MPLYINPTYLFPYFMVSLQVLVEEPMTYIAWNVRKLTEPGSPGNFPWKFAKKPRHKPLSCGKKRGGHFFACGEAKP